MKLHNTIHFTDKEELVAKMNTAISRAQMTWTA